MDPTTQTDSSPLSTVSILEIREMDVTELIGLPYLQMSEEQQRAILATMAEIRSSPQARAAKVKRTSNRLAGKPAGKAKITVKIDDLFE
jgi:hypothetical protein